MTENKHTVTTDALATLGYIVDETAQRDAIHLAVEPVVAGQLLHAGQHVGKLPNEGAPEYGITTNTVGIVDPFLRGPVHRGQRFWLILYPRQITSLRHVWEHPEFPPAFPEFKEPTFGETSSIKGADLYLSDEVKIGSVEVKVGSVGVDFGTGEVITAVVASVEEQAVSAKWLNDYADKIDETFSTLMRAAKQWVERGEYFLGARENDMYGKFEGESVHKDFWTHYQIYTGEFVDLERQRNFFTCSC